VDARRDVERPADRPDRAIDRTPNRSFSSLATFGEFWIVKGPIAPAAT
jgi:hypothetical protein